MARVILNSSSLSKSSSVEIQRASTKTSTILGSKFRFLEIEQTHLRSSTFSKSNPALRLMALREPPSLTQEISKDEVRSIGITRSVPDLFNEMKHRFLSFKKDQYMENLEHFQNLAKSQAPKFMVIACADSRVCPSSVLGLQPGEAFVVRNVANLVPPYEGGPSETNAALEFAVNSLEVENLLVIGHSCCGGIQALMSMEDEDEENSSSFIKNWVIIGKSASLSAKAAASKLDFDQQCRHCEKASVNNSLMNLLTYPWIKDKVMKGLLSIHGGYYDFVHCTFEKWTLEFNGNSSRPDGMYSIKDREFWS